MLSNRDANVEMLNVNKIDNFSTRIIELTTVVNTSMNRIRGSVKRSDLHKSTCVAASVQSTSVPSSALAAKGMQYPSNFRLRVIN